MDAIKLANYFGSVSGNILLGVDGYIDEVWQLVESRVDRDTYTVNSTMRRFGESIVAMGAGGMANEIVRKRRSYGGFTANTGNAIARLGIKPKLLGMYGASEAIDPVFGEPFANISELISIGDPAVCHILEFDDGKIMMPYLKAIYDVDWQGLNAVIGITELNRLIAEADIIAVGYWSSMPAFDEMVIGICANLPNDGRKRRMFFDFADMRKRDRASLEVTMKLLADLNKKIPMTLSLNEHEGAMMFAYYGERPLSGEPDAQGVESLRERLGLDELIIHTPQTAVAATVIEGSASVPQRFVEKPVKTTGAGDTFNGGYLAASLPTATETKLSLPERLGVANATTEYYLRNGFAPSWKELLSM